VLYIVINIVVASQWDMYDVMSMTVSEMSAIGAPTRGLWNALVAVYTLLATAFGYGVLRGAAHDRSLRVAGLSLVVYGLLGLLWPFAPMHQRDVLAAGGGNTSDTVHLVLGACAVLLMLVSMTFAAIALGRGFRTYTMVSAAFLLGFGLLTALGAPDVEANVPTPYIGVWERLNIAIFLAWNVVLAIVLLRRVTSRR
jgi:hypothetical protein